MLTEAGRQAEAHKQELFSQAGRKWSRFAKNGRLTCAGKRDLSPEPQAAPARRLLPSPAGPCRKWEPGFGAAVDRGLSGSPPATGPGEQATIRESIQKTGGELLITPPLTCPRKFGKRSPRRFKINSAGTWPCGSPPPGIAGGIELLTSSRKLAWSLGSFLDSLEEDLSQAFQELEKSEAA